MKYFVSHETRMPRCVNQQTQIWQKNSIWQASTTNLKNRMALEYPIWLEILRTRSWSWRFVPPFFLCGFHVGQKFQSG